MTVQRNALALPVLLNPAYDAILAKFILFGYNNNNSKNYYYLTVIKAFFYKRHWKVSDISYCKMKRGGMNVYVNGRKKKAFFFDGITDHFDNFIKRMEKEGKEIILPETKEKR